MNGVRFDDKHSYDDLGLILTSITVSPAAAKTVRVSIPAKDGSVDLTNVVSDDVRYEDRTIKMTFVYMGERSTWPAKYSEIENYLQGQKRRIVIDDDMSFYYTGRVSVDERQADKSVGKIVITAICDPYKYDVQSSAAEWVWDTFDFETGVINEGGNIVVDGTATIDIIARRKKSYPIITASTAMTVSYDGETFDLAKGENKIYDILFSEGINELTFTGTGTVTIDYVGGSL